MKTYTVEEMKAMELQKRFEVMVKILWEDGGNTTPKLEMFDGTVFEFKTIFKKEFEILLKISSMTITEYTKIYGNINYSTAATKTYMNNDI